MHRRRFKTLLKRRLGSHMSVGTGFLSARQVGVHPACLIVYSVGPTGLKSFVYAVTAEDKFSPRDPSEQDLIAIQSMRLEHVAEGRDSWADEVVDDQEAQQEAMREKQREEADEYLLEEAFPQVMHATGHGRIYATAISEDEQ